MLAIIVSAVVAKNILKKELKENRKLELELKNAEILQQVRNYKNTLVIRQIDNMIEISFEIIDYLNEIEKLKLSNKLFYLLEDISKISTKIKRYDLFREFIADYRLNTINKYNYLIKKINIKKHRFKLLENTIEFNKVKISIELPKFEESIDYIMRDTKICQNIILETNKLEKNPLTTDDDRIKYMNEKIENELKNNFFSEKNSYEILYNQMSYVIRSLYKLQPVISEFIIDFEED
ncbi:hypothetical protein NH286_10030 [Anaerococcus sp. NML200574]|uniref:hypothetical protein n=1 Tax=Anaerococcus sp. NML200574 TaxID=2954486 RepID=UPI0022385379|nr:hypothetical protein [Anaerococcus sp. NML200574]MCW6679479.1 hypothetical protein [Anaerococcus sp. NML200574]